MNRDYKKIGKEIALKGFFSEYLPPCFYLNNKILKYIPGKDCDLISPYTFDMSRFNGNDARRMIYIPEICSYLASYDYIRNNNILEELVLFSEKDEHSFSKILNNEDQIRYHEESYYGYITSNKRNWNSSYIDNVCKKIKMASGARKILNLDVSNCYSSFYLHMIPAILLGCDIAQNEYENKNNQLKSENYEKYIKYSELDAIIRKQNLNRTNGLIVGTLYSRIIVEAIFARIDIELEELGYRFVRYVDDYEVFVYGENSKNIITDFSNVLKRYGFSLNSEKTSESEFPYYLVQNFKRAVEDILVFEGSTVGRDALMELFNHFFKLENKGVKGAIRYLIKLIDQGINDIEFDDNELYKSYLVNIMVNNERSLNKACSILINNRDKYKLNKSDIHTIKEILDKYILYGYDLEVIWLVYLLVMTDNSDSLSGQIDNILKSNNDLAKLILYDAGLIDEEKLHNLINYAKSWILLYELYSNNAILEDELIEKLNLQSSESKNFYKKISASNIHFIDLDRRESNLYEK